MRITSRRRRPWILLSLFALALALSALGVVPVRRLITARMADLRRYLADEIERGYGLNVSYGSLSPSILRSLEIRGLDVKSAASGKSVLTARRVSVYYRIDKLLFGKISQSLREIRLVGAVADLDVERDSALIETMRRLMAPSGEGNAGFSPEKPLKIRCRDLSARLSSTEGAVSLEKTSADLLIGSFGIDINVSANAAFAASKTSSVPDFIVGLQAEGRSDIDMENASFLVSLSGHTEFLRLAPQEFILDLKSRLLELQKVPDRSPIDANASLDLDSLEYSVNLAFEGYRPSGMIGLSGSLAGLDSWLECGISGFLEMRGGIKEKTCQYRGKSDITVPQRLFPDNGRISLEADGDADRISLRTISARNDFGSGSFVGSLDWRSMVPQGDLNLGYRKGDVSFGGDFSLRQENGGLSVISENAVFVDRKLLAFSLKAQPSAAGMDFEVGSDLEPGNGPETQAARIAANGSLNLGKDPFTEVSVYLSGVPSSFIYNVASTAVTLPSGAIKSFASDFTVNAEAFLSTDFRKFSYNLPQILLSYDKKEGNYGVLSVSGGSTSFEASKLAISWDGFEVSGSLAADLSPNGPMRFSSELKLDEVPYALSGQFEKSKDFSLTGAYGFVLDGSFDGPDVLFNVGMKDMPLPLAGFTPRVTLNAFGRFRDLDEWEIDISSSSLEQTGGFLPSYARIGFDGNFNAYGGKLNSITLQDSFSELAGRADFAYRFRENPFLDIDLSLSSGKTETYQAEISLEPNSLEGKATVSSAPVARFAPKSLGGFLNLEASVTGSLKDPVVDFSGGLSQAKYNANPLSAKAKGRYAAKKIELDDFSCDYFIFSLSGGRGSYGVEDSLLNFQSDCRVAISSNAILTAAVDGTGRVMEKDGFSPSITGKLSDIELGSIRIPSWPYSFASKGGDVSLVVGKDRYLSAKLNSVGDFTLAMDSPLAVRGFADGRVADGKIDADIRNLTVDFPVIWELFGPPIVDFPSGSINADLRLSGNLSDPDFSGTGRADGFVCKIPDYLKDTFGPASSTFKVDSKDILVEKFRAVSQSGKGDVDIELSLQIDRWIPSTVNLKTRTVKNSPVRAAMKISGFDIAGNADADLGIDVSPGEIAISGTVFLQDTSVVMDQRKEQEIENSGNTAVRVKMQIGFGRKVEFLWPLRNLPILRTYFEPSSSLMVRYDSDAASYTLKGNTKLRGGEVFYLKRNFYLKEGNILFNENQSFFDPIVNLRAEMRDRDEAGNILITMKVDNSRLSQFKPKLESIPARSESEILAMFGAPEQGGDQGDTAVVDWALNSTSDVLAQFYGVRLFENTVRDTFGLDMFSVRTQVLQKLLLGTVDNTPSLGEYFDNTTLMAGKYIGSDLFFQTMLQVQMNQQNDSSNPRLDSEFSMEWNTPYFRLLWNLQPEHWEDLLVTDQSLGIYWSFSY